VGGFRSSLSHALLVARLGHLAAVWVAFVKQLRKEIAVPVFVEDQFALGRCGICLCGPDLKRAEAEPSTLLISITSMPASTTVRMMYLPGGSLASPCMELERDVDFKVSHDLCLRFVRTNC